MPSEYNVKTFHIPHMNTTLIRLHSAAISFPGIRLATLLRGCDMGRIVVTRTDFRGSNGDSENNIAKGIIAC